MRAIHGLTIAAVAAACLMFPAPGESVMSATTQATPFGASAAREPGHDFVGPVPGVGEPAPVRNLYRDDPYALADGRRYFNQFNCSGCHGGHGGGGMGPSLRDPVWIYGGGDDDIFDSIAQGRANGMPAWGALLPAEVIGKIAAYVVVLGSSQEPEPPQ